MTWFMHITVLRTVALAQNKCNVVNVRIYFFKTSFSLVSAIFSVRWTSWLNSCRLRTFLAFWLISLKWRHMQQFLTRKSLPICCELGCDDPLMQHALVFEPSWFVTSIYLSPRFPTLSQLLGRLTKTVLLQSRVGHGDSVLIYRFVLPVYFCEISNKTNRYISPVWLSGEFGSNQFDVVHGCAQGTKTNYLPGSDSRTLFVG